jgi:hypothetical protein
MRKIAKGWVVIGMKDDQKRLFAFETRFRETYA